jgi:hypothetical protein
LIQAKQKEIEELKKEIITLEEQEKKAINWEQMGPNVLWNHLIKVA